MRRLRGSLLVALILGFGIHSPLSAAVTHCFSAYQQSLRKFAAADFPGGPVKQKYKTFPFKNDTAANSRWIAEMKTPKDVDEIAPVIAAVAQYASQAAKAHQASDANARSIVSTVTSVLGEPLRNIPQHAHKNDTGPVPKLKYWLIYLPEAEGLRVLVRDSGPGRFENSEGEGEPTGASVGDLFLQAIQTGDFSLWERADNDYHDKNGSAGFGDKALIQAFENEGRVRIERYNIEKNNSNGPPETLGHQVELFFPWNPHR